MTTVLGSKFDVLSKSFDEEIEREIRTGLGDLDFSATEIKKSFLEHVTGVEESKERYSSEMRRSSLQGSYEQWRPITPILKNITSAMTATYMQIEAVLSMYTFHFTNLAKAASDQWMVLNKYISEFENRLKKINSSVTRIEDTIKCTLPQVTEDLYEGPYSDCTDIVRRGSGKSGVSFIQTNPTLAPKEVWCNNSFEGGGWTVILRRIPQNIQLDFRRTFSEYEAGFGNPHAEYWIGLKTLHYLTATESNELFVHLEMPGEYAFSRYSYFRVDGPPGYRLHVTDYNESSTGGNSLAYHDRMLFSTFNYDRDLDPVRSCSAHAGGGGFWFNFCYHTNPTGIYPPKGLPNDTAIHSLLEWRRWKGFHNFLTHLTMMIRRRSQ